MKVSKKKFNEAVDYLRQINKEDLSDLDLSEFNIRMTRINEWRFCGLNNEDFIQTNMNTCYMMATQAFHQLVGFSSDFPELCRVISQDDDNYYGIWENRCELEDIRFPKETTRPLNEEEIDYYINTFKDICPDFAYKYSRKDFEND